MVKTSSLVKCSLRSYRLSERVNSKKVYKQKIQISGSFHKTENQLFDYQELSIVTIIIRKSEPIIFHFLFNFSSHFKGKLKAFIPTPIPMIDRHLKPRGNILIFTIFILFASALIGILVSVMMRDFLKYSNEIAHYHQANALAKSASEL